MTNSDWLLKILLSQLNIRSKWIWIAHWAHSGMWYMNIKDSPILNHGGKQEVTEVALECLSIGTPKIH